MLAVLGFLWYYWNHLGGGELEAQPAKMTPTVMLTALADGQSQSKAPKAPVGVALGKTPTGT